MELLETKKKREKLLRLEKITLCRNVNIIFSENSYQESCKTKASLLESSNSGNSRNTTLLGTTLVSTVNLSHKI